MIKLKDKIGNREQVKREPVWKGPEIDGVTQSLLGGYLSCKERFRIRVIDGLAPAPSFRHQIEYGQMWHVCEEFYARGEDWIQPLKQYCRALAKNYPTDSEQITKWYYVCMTQFPIYVEWWAKHEDVKTRKPLIQEESFVVPYQLPSGRVVRLRGKWDSVDLIGKGRQQGIWLQENKTKGDVDQQKIVEQLQFDLQTMTYLVALKKHLEYVPEAKPIKGVRYNVVRRPLSGGRGSIRQHKPTKSKPQGESTEEFYLRLGQLIQEYQQEDEYFFMRWQVKVSAQDLERFETECLVPLLENLCDDFEWWDWCYDEGCNVFDGMERENVFTQHSPRHFRYPYGVYNPTAEDRHSDLDEYLKTGSTVGLERVEELFPELD